MGKVLDNVLAKLNTTYGGGTVGVMKAMGDISINKKSSGLLAMDIALTGGYPEGKIIEAYGPSSGGKSTLAIHGMVAAQKRGEVVAYVDAEHTFDQDYAASLGLNVDEMIVSQPDKGGEQALEIVDALAGSGEVSFIVIDSVAALIPASELEGNFGDAKMGLHARLMSQAMKKLTGTANVNNCTLFFINQLREKIGVIYGSNETTTGGNALKFYSSQRLDVRKSGSLEKDKEGEVSAMNVKVKVVKNKVGRPFLTADLQIDFGKGFSNEYSILTLAEDLKIIKKGGSWYSYQDNNIAQGQAKAVQFLQDNPEVANEIETTIRKHYNLPI